MVTIEVENEKKPPCRDQLDGFLFENGWISHRVFITQRLAILRNLFAGRHAIHMEKEWLVLCNNLQVAPQIAALYI